MIEAALFALDLILVAYCCWIVIRIEKKTVIESTDLGVFAFKKNKKDAGK